MIARLFASCLFFLLALPVFANDGAPAYLLRHGDSIQISVWREDGLQREVRVLPDGSVTFPLAGRVVVAGLSSSDAEKRIAEKLKEFIPDPVVTVVITGIEGSRVYVIGKVSKPGPIMLTAPTTTALQAISQAGGLDKFADGNGIRVLRETDKGIEVFPVRFNDLLRGDELKTNLQLKAGDTILVP